MILATYDERIARATFPRVADLLRSEIKRYMDARGIPHALKYIDPSYIIRSVPATANDKVYCGFLGQYAGGPVERIDIDRYQLRLDQTGEGGRSIEL